MGGKKKVALVLPGAVSLGSFEAGAVSVFLYEVLNNPESEYEIDLIVGTSAGALTGAVSAITLAYDLDPAILKEAWTSIDLDDLLKLNPGDKSILSSSKVRQQVNDFVKQPAKKAGKSIELIIVATNLDGVQYQLKYRSGNNGDEDDFTFKTISYEDSIHFKIGPEFNDWDRLRQAVQASSAYPAAFEHVPIKRRFGNKDKVNRCCRTYNYTDGGVVNNHPLNLAIEKVACLLAQSETYDEERIFLVIEPSPSHLDAEREVGPLDVVGKSLWTIPQNQTMYRDLFEVEKLNRQIRWKDSFVELLAKVVNNHASAFDIRQLKQLCWRMAEELGQVQGIAPDDFLEQELARINKTYQKELSKINLPRHFEYLCFVMDNLLGLRVRKPYRVEMISPRNPDEELAGVALGNFGGFVCKDYMLHDYETGQYYAAKWLDKEADQYTTMNIVNMTIPAKTQERVITQIIQNAIPLLISELERKGRIFGGAELEERVAVKYLLVVFKSLVKYYWQRFINCFNRK